jgi:hypothetical protein
VLGTFAVGSAPACVAFDGADIWVANDLSNTVSKVPESARGNERTEVLKQQ